ncbi:hypothetical protein KIN20_011553 [Parelaphostrongylus tenuis]|uniref:Uncharacterized protein n=1 Tax=Parelaphostrongylus tenuis TaxID=148309 RepID=A0AAD5M9M1_PARTN|nr:hypothetical protein KIN20_011553 [Parelaphostrongylus tenuis]
MENLLSATSILMLRNMWPSKKMEKRIDNEDGALSVFRAALAGAVTRNRTRFAREVDEYSTTAPPRPFYYK